MNRLAQEKSAYLKQHAANPVDWYPWGQEAFAKARAESKPLLISIGYSTCHWCHVMEHESFEDHDVAKFLNANFVAVKVDREEHPDVDGFYMDALQTLTRRGGWPLNMFVTPDLQPFFGGTYFPKPMFLNLLVQIDQVWRTESERVHEQAKQLLDAIQSGHPFAAASAGPELTPEVFAARIPTIHAKLVEIKLRSFDPVWGGFGGAPKFPRSHELTALLRAVRSIEEPARRSSTLKAVAQTLRGMAYGGLRDHLRGGFHRYSTDERWLVPHFEKMLYDQALLVRTYAEAYRVFREDFYADVVEETLDYLEAEMRLPSGGFSAAQDADSEGVEGKYFVWTRDELAEIFKKEDPKLVGDFFRLHSIEIEGNWEETNVLAAPMDADWAKLQSSDMKRLRARLLELRAKRIPPLLDTKAITAWNAWMASGLLHASMALADKPELSKRLSDAAERTVDYLLSLGGTTQSLPRVVYDSNRKGTGYLEDYAAVIESIQLLASRRVSAKHWVLARKYIDAAEKLFRGADGKLRSRDAQSNAEIPADRLEYQDGATPAAISTYLGCLLRQSLAESEPTLTELALRDLTPLTVIIEDHPIILTYLLTELDLLKGCIVKVPKGAADKVWPEWARRGEFATDVIFTESADSAQFEACDLRSCFGRGATLADALKLP